MGTEHLCSERLRWLSSCSVPTGFQPFKKLSQSTLTVVSIIQEMSPPPQKKKKHLHVLFISCTAVEYELLTGCLPLTEAVQQKCINLQIWMLLLRQNNILERRVIKFYVCQTNRLYQKPSHSCRNRDIHTLLWEDPHQEEKTATVTLITPLLFNKWAFYFMTACCQHCSRSVRRSLRQSLLIIYQRYLRPHSRTFTSLILLHHAAFKVVLERRMKREMGSEAEKLKHSKQKMFEG